MLRRSAIRRCRKALRRGEPIPLEKQLARVKAYNRAQGRCELQKSPQCMGSKVLPLEGDLLVRGHLHHELSKRRFGWQESEETGQKHLWVCAFCHAWEHNGGKPVPRKDAA